MEFSEWLKAARQSAGLTLMGFGEKAGVSHSAILRLEAGDRSPSRDMVIKLADALGVSRDAALFAGGFLPESALEIVTNEDEAAILTLYRNSSITTQRLMKGLVREVADQQVA